VSDGEHPLAIRLSFVALILPAVTAWPELLARFVRRMQREAALAGPFVPDPNRGLVVGGWMLLGAAVLTLLGTQLDWIPVVGMVAPAVHPGAAAAWIYGLFALWAAIEALRETPRARLAVALFGAYSLVYLPIAALLVAFGVGEPTTSVTQIAGFRASLTGGLSWLAPLVPILLLTTIALGRERNAC
jgi:hypothetical protein